MAQVTMELRDLLTTNFELFDFDYTFDDLRFKKEIEEAIVLYYEDYEIGFETPDQFKRKFIGRMKRIMPYYNNLHNTTLLAYDPLINSKMTESLDQLAISNNNQIANTNTTADGTTDIIGGTTNNQTTDSTGLTTNDLKTSNISLTTNDLVNDTTENATTDTNTTNSDYPQQLIDERNYLEAEQNGLTKTDRTANSNDSGTVDTTENGTNTGTVNTTENSTLDGATTTTTDTTSNDTSNSDSSVSNDGETNTSYEKTIEGLTGITYQDLIFKERNNLLRIIDMILAELKTLFLLVY